MNNECVLYFWCIWLHLSYSSVLFAVIWSSFILRSDHSVEPSKPSSPQARLVMTEKGEAHLDTIQNDIPLFSLADCKAWLSVELYVFVSPFLCLSLCVWDMMLYFVTSMRANVPRTTWTGPHSCICCWSITSTVSNIFYVCVCSGNQRWWLVCRMFISSTLWVSLCKARVFMEFGQR